MTNPHLRAALADVLEAILPIREDDDDTSQFDDNYVTINAVKNFDNVKDLYQSVLQLYSDIEFTGLNFFKVSLKLCVFPNIDLFFTSLYLFQTTVFQKLT